MPVYNPYAPPARRPMVGPYTANYPQNAGLAAGVNALADMNRANAMRQPVPYDGSAGMNPTGAGQYANRVAGGGLMGNYGAQQNYSQTGYMPRMTVGGAYGLGGQDPLGQNRLTDQQVYAGLARPGYATSGAIGLGMAPTTQAGYDQQMAAQNPNARNFGGLLPTNITSANGTVRPGYMAAPAQPGVGQSQQNAWAAANGMTVALRPDGTGTMGPSSTLGAMSNRDIALAGITGRGPNQKENLNPGGREAYKTALAQRQDAARTQTLNRVAMRGGLMGQPGATGQAPNDQWAGIAQLGAHLGGLVQSGVLQPDQARQIMQQRMGATGLKIPASRENPLAIKARQQVGPDKMAEFAALPNGQARDAWLNVHGVTDPAVRNFLHSQVSIGQNQPPSIMGNIGLGLGTAIVGGLAQNPSFGAIVPRPPVGVRRPGQQPAAPPPPAPPTNNGWGIPSWMWPS